MTIIYQTPKKTPSTTAIVGGVWCFDMSAKTIISQLN
ncbi:hypothetical protein RH772_002637 [Staphylococcus aureus]